MRGMLSAPERSKAAGVVGRDGPMPDDDVAVTDEMIC